MRRRLTTKLSDCPPGTVVERRKENRMASKHKSQSGWAVRCSALVRCHGLMSDGFRVKTAEFVCPKFVIIKLPVGRNVIYALAPGSDASFCKSVKWCAWKSPEKLVCPDLNPIRILGLIASSCATSLSFNGFGRVANSNSAILTDDCCSFWNALMRSSRLTRKFAKMNPPVTNEPASQLATIKMEGICHVPDAV